MSFKKYNHGKNQANINLVESLIDLNPRVSYSYFEEETFLSRGTLNRIIKDNLYISRRSSRWVLYHLTLENKHRRLEFCKAILKKFKSGDYRIRSDIDRR